MTTYDSKGNRVPYVDQSASVLTRWTRERPLGRQWDWLKPSGRLEYPLGSFPNVLEHMGPGAMLSALPFPCLWPLACMGDLPACLCMSCEVCSGPGDELPPSARGKSRTEIEFEAAQRRSLAGRSLTAALVPGESLAWHGVPRRARHQSEALALPNMPAEGPCNCQLPERTSSGDRFVGYPEFAFGVTNARAIVAAFDLKKSDALGGHMLRSTVVFSMSLRDAENVRVHEAHHVFFGPENAGPGPIAGPACSALAGSPLAQGMIWCAPLLTCNARHFTPARVPKHAQALATHGVGFFDLEEADAAAAVAAIRAYAGAELALPESPVLLDGSSNLAAPESEGPVEEVMTPQLLEELGVVLSGSARAPPPIHGGVGGAVVTPVTPVTPVGEEMDRGVEVELAAPVDVGAV